VEREGADAQHVEAVAAAFQHGRGGPVLAFARNCCRLLRFKRFTSAYEILFSKFDPSTTMAELTSALKMPNPAFNNSAFNSADG